MPEYSVFVLDANDRVCGSTSVTCATDAEALEAAAVVIPPGAAAEVWLLRRMVGRVRNDA